MKSIVLAWAVVSTSSAVRFSASKSIDVSICCKGGVNARSMMNNIVIVQHTVLWHSIFRQNQRQFRLRARKSLENLIRSFVG
jgi:hypothetical protein